MHIRKPRQVRTLKLEILRFQQNAHMAFAPGRRNFGTYEKHFVEKKSIETEISRE